MTQEYFLSVNKQNEDCYISSTSIRKTTPNFVSMHLNAKYPTINTENWLRIQEQRFLEIDCKRRGKPLPQGNTGVSKYLRLLFVEGQERTVVVCEISHGVYAIESRAGWPYVMRRLQLEKQSVRGHSISMRPVENVLCNRAYTGLIGCRADVHARNATRHCYADGPICDADSPSDRPSQ